MWSAHDLCTDSTKTSTAREIFNWNVMCFFLPHNSLIFSSTFHVGHLRTAPWDVSFFKVKHLSPEESKTKMMFFQHNLFNLNSRSCVLVWNLQLWLPHTFQHFWARIRFHQRIKRELKEFVPRSNRRVCSLPNDGCFETCSFTALPAVLPPPLHLI